MSYAFADTKTDKQDDPTMFNFPATPPKWVRMVHIGRLAPMSAHCFDHHLGALPLDQAHCLSEKRIALARNDPARRAAGSRHVQRHGIAPSHRLLGQHGCASPAVGVLTGGRIINGP